MLAICFCCQDDECLNALYMTTNSTYVNFLQETRIEATRDAYLYECVWCRRSIQPNGRRFDKLYKAGTRAKTHGGREGRDRFNSWYFVYRNYQQFPLVSPIQWQKAHCESSSGGTWRTFDGHWLRESSANCIVYSVYNENCDNPVFQRSTT